MILADTSVWVDHLRQRSRAMSEWLLAGEIVCHPFVIGELACGGILNCGDVYELLTELPSLPKAEDREVLEFIETHRLAGRGLGLVDVHLLASCALSRTAIATRDRRLAAVAREMGLCQS